MAEPEDKTATAARAESSAAVRAVPVDRAGLKEADRAECWAAEREDREEPEHKAALRVPVVLKAVAALEIRVADSKVA